MERSTSIQNTVGGKGGYVFRRLVHLSLLIVPLIYYPYGENIAQFFHLSNRELLLVIIAINVIFELLRLFFGWTLWGHRKHESRTISSFFWSILSVCLVMMLTAKQNGIPIIFSCAIVDPLLGELRRTRLGRRFITTLIGIAAVMVIWWIGTAWLGTDWRLALLMGPMIVGLEWPNFRWIDDNALMQLGPMLFILLLYGIG